MAWTTRELIQLGLLLSCVPLQYYFSEYNKESDAVLKLVKEVSSFRDYCLNLFRVPGKVLWFRFLSWFVVNILGIEEGDAEESPAIEVFEYRKRTLIRMPKKVHSTHPKEVWFRIGQVVEHMSENYKGVIIDWNFDDELKLPIYSLLIDEQNGHAISAVKDVTQDEIYLLEKEQVVNSYLTNYFISYDGAQYIPRPWLKKMFPKD